MHQARASEEKYRDPDRDGRRFNEGSLSNPKAIGRGVPVIVYERFTVGSDSELHALRTLTRSLRPALLI
jgi:hypothetical protein